MLVVISDLHFVDETAGRHNLPAEAFTSVFLDDVVSLARARRAKEVKLLLLGDLVDLIRSEQWLGTRDKVFPERSRPWGERGVADVTAWKQGPTGSATERRCLDILGRLPRAGRRPDRSEASILARNWDTFAFFRDLPGALRERLVQNDLPVELIYVPGNHDRMVNLYPAVRQAVQRMFGLTLTAGTVAGDPAGAWRFRDDYLSPEYGVYARHGHQYDPWNYGGEEDHSPGAQLRVSIGDVFTTEFAVKIPKLVAGYGPARPSKAHQALVENLKDMDNVRPLSRVVEWFYYRLQQEEVQKVHRVLAKAFAETVKQLLDLPFVKTWRSQSTRSDEYLRLLGNRWVNWFPDALLDRLEAEYLLPLVLGATGVGSDPDQDPYALAAFHERAWRDDPRVRFILYGHTHVPTQVPLEVDDRREVLYLNTGTWRARIHRTIGADRSPGFTKLKHLTYTVFYRADEDVDGKRPGTVSFDVWTGCRMKPE